MPTRAQKSLSLPSTLVAAAAASESDSSSVSTMSSIDQVVLVGLRCRLVELGLGLLHRGAVDVGDGDDRVERLDDLVPAPGDDLLDLGPALAAGATGERLDAAADGAQHRVAVEELRDRGKLAHRTHRRHHRQRAVQRPHAVLGRLVREQLLEDDQVVGVVLGRCEPVGVGLGELLPRRVVDQVVVGAGADECGQVGDRLEDVEVLVLAEEGLPLVAVGAPPRRPQCVHVALGQRQPDRHDVSSHAAQPNDLVWGPRGHGCALPRARRTVAVPQPVRRLGCSSSLP